MSINIILITIGVLLVFITMLLLIVVVRQHIILSRTADQHEKVSTLIYHFEKRIDNVLTEVVKEPE